LASEEEDEEGEDVSSTEDGEEEDDKLQELKHQYATKVGREVSRHFWGCIVKYTYYVHKKNYIEHGLKLCYQLRNIHICISLRCSMQQQIITVCLNNI
jgi:hypothetical protein